MKTRIKTSPLPTSRSLHIASVALLALMLPLTVAAQDSETPGSEAEPFIESVQTTVVNVEVFVTDRRGNPIKGLTIDDFEVFEDGEPVEVTNFFAVENGQQALEGLEGLPETERQLRLRELGELPPEQKLHLIIYVDNFNLFPASRNRTLARVRNFISGSLNRDDRVMVVSYDRSLHLRQPFTNDKAAIADALLGLEELSGSASLREREREQALEEISEADNESYAMSAARTYAESVEAELTIGLRGLSRQIELLSGLVGRKALIYVSDGIPQVIGEDLFFYVDERFPRARARMEAGVFDMSLKYQNLISKANAAGITFYSLDARGLRSNSSVSAQYAGTTQGGGLPFIDSVNNANMREPLHRMADDTGGQAVTNTNAIEAGLGKFLNDFRNYYSLGYQPTHFGGGRYYEIDVKVKRDGVKVRHRNGYRDKTAEARLADSTLASLLYGAEGNPLDVDIGFGSSRRDGKSSIVPVEVKIPIGNLTMVPQSGSYLGRIKVAVAVMDEEGGLSPVEQQAPFTIRVPENEIDLARSKNYVYEVMLAMRPGLSRVAVTVRDEYTSQTSFVRRTIKIGA